MFCKICGTVLDPRGKCINCEKRTGINTTKEIQNPIKAEIGSLD